MRVLHGRLGRRHGSGVVRLRAVAQLLEGGKVHGEAREERQMVAALRVLHPHARQPNPHLAPRHLPEVLERLARIVPGDVLRMEQLRPRRRARSRHPVGTLHRQHVLLLPVLLRHHGRIPAVDSGDHGRDGDVRQMHRPFGTRPAMGQEHHEARPMLPRLPRGEGALPAVAGEMHGLCDVLHERDGNARRDSRMA